MCRSASTATDDWPEPAGASLNRLGQQKHTKLLKGNGSQQELATPVYQTFTDVP